MQTEYDPHQIEQEVQDYWLEQHSFEVTEDPSREKFYCLSMLPYPSGNLHMGHVRNYTIGDVMSRYQRMKGRNVLQPMGWDAFGLPAENAAIQRSIPPARWTYQNIEHMRTQLMRMGFGYDWSREVNTTDPGYFKWSQWIFLQLYNSWFNPETNKAQPIDTLEYPVDITSDEAKRDYRDSHRLAFVAKAPVNWCPELGTVLANEEVINGKSEVGGHPVVRKPMQQWMLRITAFAQRLLDDLETIDWSDSLKEMQRNWIGKSTGMEVQFPYDTASIGHDGTLKVFTTRPDTLMGATYVAVAAEHPLATQAAEGNAELQAFIDECKRGGVAEADIATQEKKGLPTPLYVLHPLTGEKLPVWVANYVLMGYGEGAVMAVPAHDERDFAFASKYRLPIKPVIRTSAGDATPEPWQDAYGEKGELINSEEFDGLDYDSAFTAIGEVLKQKGLGEPRTQFRLRDWGISRQRYWGCPIPIIHCDSCGDVPVPDDQLPVVLPEDVIPDGAGSPLAKMPEFYECTCPKCGAAAKRETDTMDTFVESSWYYARYASPQYDQGMVDPAAANHWLPVDQYIGGIEHAILHLLYARFFHKLMRDEGLVNSNEPFKNLLTQGMVLADTYYRLEANGSKTWFNPADVDIERDGKGKIVAATLRSDGQPVEIGGTEKMSKSKNNGVDPQAMIDQYGADTCRLFMMFASPPDMSLEWSDSGVEGAQRFLRRVWRLSQQHHAKGPAGKADLGSLSDEQKAVRRAIHLAIKQASQDIGQHHKFNTAIAAVMTLMNVLEKAPQDAEQDRALLQEGLETVALVLAPIAPHISHSLWQSLGHNDAIIDARWPQVDESALVQDSLQLVIQVNGKLRGHIEVAADASRELIEATARDNENVLRFTEGLTIRKVIVVPGKLVNIVAN